MVEPNGSRPVRWSGLRAGGGGAGVRPGRPGVPRRPLPGLRRAARRRPGARRTRCSGCRSRCRTRACSELLRGRDLGRIWADAQPADEFAAFNLLHRNSLLEREGPAHDRLRRLVAGAFNRGHTARLEPAGARAGRPAGRRAGRPDRRRGQRRPDRRGGRAAAGRGDRRAARRAGAGPLGAARLVEHDRHDVRAGASDAAAAGGGRAGAPPSSSTALRELAAHRRSAPGRRPGHRPAGRRHRTGRAGRHGGAAADGRARGDGQRDRQRGAGPAAASRTSGERLLADPGLDPTARRGADPLRPAAAAVRAHRGRRHRGGRAPGPGRHEDRRAARRGGARPGGVRPAGRSWTWAAGATRTWASAPACTTAWAPRWPGWRSPPRWTRCAPGCPALRLAAEPAAPPGLRHARAARAAGHDPSSRAVHRALTQLAAAAPGAGRAAG